MNMYQYMEMYYDYIPHKVNAGGRAVDFPHREMSAVLFGRECLSNRDTHYLCSQGKEFLHCKWCRKTITRKKFNRIVEEEFGGV